MMRSRSCLASGGLLGCVLLMSRTATAEPQYELDSSFRAPVFTSFATSPRTLVLPDDRFFAFSNLSPRTQSAFHRLDGLRTGNLIRFLPDGSHDPTFLLDEDLFGWTINAVAVALDGKFMVACVPPFGSADLRNRVVRLNGDGSIDRTFDAGAGATPTSSGDCIIQAIVVDPAGRTIVGGQFGDFNGSGRSHLVRLTTGGAVDSSFAPINLRTEYLTGVPLGIQTNGGIAIQGDGRILVAGAFSHVNESPRLGVARLLDDGSVDPDFAPSGYDTRSSPSSSTRRPVNAIAIQPDGKVLIAGTFNPIAGGPGGSALIQMVVRLNTNGSVDSSFSAGRRGNSLEARAVALLSNGDTLVASNPAITRFQPDGALDESFNANAPFNQVLRLMNVSTQSGEKVLFSGTFREIAGTLYTGLARLQPDGTRDTAFKPGETQREQLPGQVAQRKDGRIVVGGFLDRVNGTPRSLLAVLKPDGALAPLTYPDDAFTSAFFLQPDDKLLRWGYGRLTGAFAVRRYNVDGSLDGSFTPAPETIQFQDALLQPDGRYLLSTGSSTQAVANEVLLTRMNADGSKGESFDLGIEEHRLVERYEYTREIYRMYDGNNRALALLPSGKIIYKYFDGHYRIVLLEPNGAIDPNFASGTATARATREVFPAVYDPQTGRTLQPSEGVVQPTSLGPWIASLEPDGRITLGGQFTSYNGTSAGGIVRLNADGTLHSTLGSGAAFINTPVTNEREPSVTEMHRDFAGRLLVAGDFESFHGVPCPGIARLNPDGTLDTSFVPPVAGRNTGVAFNNHSVLTRQGAGRFLLTGNYAASGGSSTATSIFRLRIPSRATGMLKTPANALQIQFTGVPGETYRIQTSSSLTTSSFIDASGPVEAAADGTFVYEDATAFSSLQRFYRAVSLE